MLGSKHSRLQNWRDHSIHPVYVIQPPVQGPDIPARYSYSLLKEIETCPRRWWLVHAHYRGIHGRYPEQVIPQAIQGIVMHGVLAKYALHLAQAGYPPLGSSEFAVAHSSFPLKETIRQLKSCALNKFANNPRVDIQVLRRNISLDSCIGAFGRLVQTAYSTLSTRNLEPVESDLGAGFRPASRSQSNATAFPFRASQDTQTRQLKIPSRVLLPEARIEIEEPPFTAILDLVVTGNDGEDILVDFKTGRPLPEHDVQTRIYAVVWWIATKRVIRKRMIVYADHPTVSLPGLSVRECVAESQMLHSRICRAKAILSECPPAAKPSAKECRYCSVRQLCDEYWTASETEELRWNIRVGMKSNVEVTWKDLELPIEGARDLGKAIAFPGRPRVIAPIPHQSRPVHFRNYHCVRMLQVGLQPRDKVLLVVWSRYSEAFWK